MLEGESGANDPVGIALLASLLAATGAGGAAHALGTGIGDFVLQMAVGGAVGVAGGYGLLLLTRKVPLPNAGLYPLRTLAGAAVIYGLATVAHGSGFLAVFVAGILLGDAPVPYREEIERFHAALASLGEIVAFVLLGLTITVPHLNDGNALVIGLVLAVLLAFLVRPLLVGVLIWPIRLSRGERGFVLWSGLKGAVPILLGTFIITAGQPDQDLRVYHIIFVVVAFSVVVQGGLVPTVAARLGVPMRTVPAAPFTTGMRLREEPQGVHRYHVGVASSADGATLGELRLGHGAWVNLVSRNGQLLPARGDTRLRAGDELLLQVDPESDADPGHLFAAPG